MIIVTGATGFIGSAFVWELNKQGITNVLCVDSKEDANLYRDLSSIEASTESSIKLNNLSHLKFQNLISKEDLLKVLESSMGASLNSSGLGSEPVQWIIHMGANSSTTATDRSAVMETNFEYTKKLFNWCAKNQVHFIYASSAATYGDGSKGYDDQTSAFDLKPLNLYGESKVLFDQYFETQTREKKPLPPTCYGLKFFNVYGPQEYHKEDMASVVFKAFHQIKENKFLNLFKSHNKNYRDGYQMRDFVYIKDVTSWMYQLMNKKGGHGIYNMGFGKARPWMDLASEVFKNMKIPTNIRWIDMPENIQDKYQYFTEAKMNKLLSLKISHPQWPLEKGIADYVQNYLDKKDPYLKP